MKKFLLFSAAAIAAISVNAQAIKKAAPAESLQLSTSNTIMRASNVLNSKSNVMATRQSSAKIEEVRAAIASGKAVKKAAPAQSSVYGNYVECFTSYSSSSEDISYEENHSISVTPYVYTDPETGLSEEYVELNGLCGGWADVLGEYDEEEGVISVPAQVCYMHDQYGEFDLYCIVEDGGQFKPSEMATYTVFEEDGVRYLQQNEAGLLIFMADYSEQIGQQVNWTVAWDTYCIGANAQLVFSIYDSQTKSWTDDVTIETFAENFGDAMSIYNFCDLGAPFNIGIAEDGTFTSQCGQDIYYYDKQSDWVKMFSYYWDENEVSIVDLTYNGFITQGGVYVFGEPLEGNNVDWNYFFPGFGEMWFGKIYAGIQLIPYDSDYAIQNGINSVLAPEFSKASFNLAGQRVNKANGLVIENGKKVIR